MVKEHKRSSETLLAQAGHFIDPVTGAITPPIHPSTTFARDREYQLTGDYIYQRNDSPVDRQAEKVLCLLEGGSDARLFASGMAGINAVFETVASGSHIVAPEVMYHGAQDWLRRISERRNIGLTLFDSADPSGLENALQPGKTSLVWIESPVNPTWDVIDIAAAANAAHAAGAALAVDSTVATPITTQPIKLGADLVFHSATKYLNGHSDVLGGAVISAKKDERWEEIKLVRKQIGGVLGPFESWLLLRGMRTLALRFHKACENAMAIARHFEDHPAITRVLYPGLQSHPGHQIAIRQMTAGFSGMLSFLINGGEAQANRVASSTEVFLPATSLGGVESLIEHRAAVEGPHSIVPRNLLRLSVGIENQADLIDDLEAALSKV